jgi:hypothetical protein
VHRIFNYPQVDKQAREGLPGQLQRKLVADDADITNGSRSSAAAEIPLKDTVVFMIASVRRSG